MAFRFSAVAAVLVACSLLLAAPVHAQAQSGGGGAPAAQAPEPIKVDDAKLDAFASAAAAVIRIRQAWKPKIEGAKTQQESQEMSDGAQLEMKLAVENTAGITMREYVAIAEASRANQRLASAIQQRLAVLMAPTAPAK